MTINMDATENEDVQLTEQNFRHVCRLCLRADDEFVDIFHRIDPNTLKRPLIDRLYELYHLKVLENDGLPTNICHRCLYNTELFANFCESVHRSEQKLRDFVQALAAHSEDLMNSEIQRTRQLTESSETNEAEDVDTNEIIVIDPTKCYESSDEEFDEDDELKAQNTSGEQANYELIASMYNRLALPESEQNLMPAQGSSKKSHQNANSIDNSDAFRNASFCKYCEAAFSQREQCEAHEMNYHDPVSPYVCNYCPFRCDSRFNVIAHIKQYHEAEKPYVCIQCNKNFVRRADLRKHAICHTGIRPFDCSICGKTFSRKTNLTKHLKVHSGPKRFACKHCTRSFGSNNDLMRHERIHSDPTKTHQCPVCLACFPRRDGLLQHQRKHNHNVMAIDLKPQPMPYNSVTANHPPQMDQYSLQTMFESKPIDNVVYSKCTISSESNSMQIPKIRITKQIKKRFDCDNCTKTFATMSSLKNHKRTHSNTASVAGTAVPSIWCTICSKTFNTKRELIRHKKTHSNRKNPAALPESAFLPENLKRGTHMYGAEMKQATATAAPSMSQQMFGQQQPFRPDMFRPQFYAEYDLSEANK